MAFVNDNFYATSERIYNDLCLLYKEKRWFNSCYFSGYIIECYAKLILQKMGKTPREIRTFSHSINKLDLALQSYITNLLIGGIVPPSYIRNINVVCPNISSGLQAWNPESRYDEGIGFWDESTANLFFNEADDIIVTIVQMRIDGVI
jgi:hypothetical protein